MTVYMDGQASRLQAWLRERFAENERMGYSIHYMGSQLGWSEHQTRHAVDYTRYKVLSPDGQIVCFKVNGVSYYKLPSPNEAAEYVELRGSGIARQIANVLFLVRKGRAKWGDLPYLVSAQTHLLAELEEMDAMGVPGIQELLVEVMRPITNGT